MNQGIGARVDIVSLPKAGVHSFSHLDIRCSNFENRWSVL